MKTSIENPPASLRHTKKSQGSKKLNDKKKEQTKQPPSDLLEQHLPLVKIIVGSMRHHFPAHADIEELMSVGVLGLLSAVENYDALKGKTFKTYASIRIRGSILDELRKLDWMPRSARLKRRMVNGTIEKLEQSLGRAPTNEEIQQELGLSDKKFRKLKLQTNPISIVFLDGAVGDEESNMHDAIADENQSSSYEDLEKSELINLMADKIQELPDRQRKILAMYYHENMRLAEIAEVFDLSEARISQIHSQALATLRRYIGRVTRSY